VPEILEHGVTGFLIKDNIEEAVRFVNDTPRLSRKRCRETFEKRFTAERMARDYVDVYRKLINAEPLPINSGPRVSGSKLTTPAMLNLQPESSNPL
jgi:hypothetical protein